jgi:hypothetical protein
MVDGLLTVESILKPSWLVRKRINQSSIMSPYVWIATIAQQDHSTACEIKGYVARNNHPMVLSDRRAIKRIVQKLNFTSATYERVGSDGQGRALHSFNKDTEKAD